MVKLFHFGQEVITGKNKTHSFDNYILWKLMTAKNSKHVEYGNE